MRLLSPAVGVVIVALLSGCVANPPREVNLNNKFNPDETKRFLESGKNTVKGSALMRQSGGAVVTCAGNKVSLVPSTVYSNERIFAIYGSIERGVSSRPVKFIPENDEYNRTGRRVSVCDAQGYFQFDNVADGEFFVTAVVQWNAPGAYGPTPQGGGLMQRVSVSNSEVKNIVLAP